MATESDPPRATSKLRFSSKAVPNKSDFDAITESPQTSAFVYNSEGQLGSDGESESDDESPNMHSLQRNAFAYQGDPSDYSPYGIILSLSVSLSLCYFNFYM